MDEIEVQDALTVSNRHYTKEGYLVAPAILARAGILPYTARELKLTDRMPNAIVQVKRETAELAKSVASFEGQPITMDHPPANVDASTWRQLAVGDVRDVLVSDDRMCGTLIVRDKAAIEEIKAGKQALSNGYKFQLKPASGPGYEFEQVNIVGNHVAIVDRARCGPSCVVGDRAPIIPEQKEKQPMVKLALDGYPSEVDETTAGIVVRRLQSELAEANAQLNTLRNKKPMIRVGDRDLDQAEVTAEIQRRETRIGELEKAVLTPERFKAEVAARSKVMLQAQDMLPNFSAEDGADTSAIRLGVLKQLMPTNPAVKAQIDAALSGQDIDKAESGQVRTIFDLVHAGFKATSVSRTANQHNVELGQQILTGNRQGHDAGNQLTGRDSYLHFLENAWRNPNDTSRKEEV